VGYPDQLTTLNYIKKDIINKTITTIASFKGFHQNFRCSCSVHLTGSIKLSFFIPLLAFMGCFLCDQTTKKQVFAFPSTDATPTSSQTHSLKTEIF